MILPPELDLDIYRQHQDLSAMSNDELRAHFNQFGKREGRMASSIGSRSDFIGLIDRSSPALEIGPFCNPQLAGGSIRYFDVLDQQHLKERADGIGVDSSQVPHIDYISPSGDLRIVDQKFSTIFSSHCIEHQPDLIWHLNCVEAILEPEGKYFLIIPDKRYCFDHFIPDSTLAEISGAFYERRRKHLFKSVFEHRLMTCHNDPQLHWKGRHGPCPQPNIEGLRRVTEEWNAAAGGYIDVHAWQFTPENFRSIIDDTGNLGLHSFRIERVYSTLYLGIEFFAVLKLGDSNSISSSIV